jgi:glyoxylase-like metal-dependent hydrolase (beta-lactamase superfamily II)
MSINTIHPLKWCCFPAGESGFFRAPVLLSGERDAILIDAGFTLSDGLKITQEIRNTGRKLTTIYITQSDPDYYFGLKPVTDAFPEARVIAAASTRDAILETAGQKLAVWRTLLGNNGPQTLSEIIIPEAHRSPVLSLEGHSIHIMEADALENRRWLWVPSLKAVFGGVLVFSGLHVWTADTPTPEARAAWLRALDTMAQLKPEVVVPGHMQTYSLTDASAIQWTRNWLMAFEAELARSENSAALVDALLTRYPEAGFVIALQTGAGVATGEIVWG